MILVEALRKAHGRGQQRRWILDGLALRVEAGTVCALQGASGAGKTTLLNILGGLDTDFEGRVEVAGASLRGLDDPALSRFRRDTVGFLFQDFHLLDELSALDNVTLPGRLDPAPRREALRARGLDLLAEVGLEGRADDRPSALSGGERQRVALARALLRSPALILADEPTGNLDPQTGAALLDLLRRCVASQPCAAVVATHDPQVASRADRRLRLHQGCLQEEAPA